MWNRNGTESPRYRMILIQGSIASGSWAWRLSQELMSIPEGARRDVLNRGFTGLTTTCKDLAVCMFGNQWALFMSFLTAAAISDKNERNHTQIRKPPQPRFIGAQAMGRVTFAFVTWETRTSAGMSIIPKLHQIIHSR
jgi:hypothetical protein